MLSIAARYMAMAERVEEWTATRESAIESDEADRGAPARSTYPVRCGGVRSRMVRVKQDPS